MCNGRLQLQAITAVLACLAMPFAIAAQTVDNSDLDELVDPTTPLLLNTTVQQSAQNLFSLLSTYRVTSILIRPNMKVAVINSRQVREGDLIGNAEVVKIDKNSVTLAVAGEQQVLELYGRSIKKSTEGEN